MNALRKKRMDLGLSQYELARLLDVHKGSIDKWERHVVKPGPPMARRIIRFLDRDTTRVGD